MKSLKTMLIVAALVIVAGSAYLIYTSNTPGSDSEYGILSELGKTFAASLQSACEANDLDAVLKVAALVDEYAAKGELPGDDQKWLLGIVKTAETKNWTKATSQINALIAAQK